MQSTLFMRVEDEKGQSWSGLKTYFRDSNIHSRCVYDRVDCKNYHVIALKIFYDVPLFYERRIGDRIDKKEEWRRWGKTEESENEKLM